ncbi:MAG: hypothetical protein AB7V56_16855 [Candidatus Nitrosocosmicus sp.]
MQESFTFENNMFIAKINVQNSTNQIDKIKSMYIRRITLQAKRIFTEKKDEFSKQVNTIPIN